MKLDISTEQAGTGVIVRVKGDVDMNSSPELRAALGKVFQQAVPGTRALVISLLQVRYMDSSGIATLVEALQTCMKRSMLLRLAELSPSVKDIFDLARLTSVFEIYPAIPESLRDL